MPISINDYLFGPLDTEYCLYFYILSVFGFVGMLLAVTSLVPLLLHGNADAKTLMAIFMGSIIYLSTYFQNRLLYSMFMTKEGLETSYARRKHRK
jgi:hypothetical protein